MPTTLTIPKTPVAGPARKLHLFSLYLDFPAAIHARWMVRSISKLAGPDWLTSSEMWKIDALNSSANFRQMMTRDAARADVILVTVTSLAHPEPALTNWLAALATEKSDQPGLLLALLGDDHLHASELDWMVKPLIRYGRQMGREVLWHCPSENVTNEAGWLAEDLANLLACKQATVMGGATKA